MLSTAATSRKSYRKGYDTKCIKKKKLLRRLCCRKKLLSHFLCCKNCCVVLGVAKTATSPLVLTIKPDN